MIADGSYEDARPCVGCGKRLDGQLQRDERIAALRGHVVTLYEKGKALGGQLRVAIAPPGKINLAPLAASRYGAAASSSKRPTARGMSFPPTRSSSPSATGRIEAWPWRSRARSTRSAKSAMLARAPAS
jgi:hypothetical protein